MPLSQMINTCMENGRFPDFLDTAFLYLFIQNSSVDETTDRKSASSYRMVPLERTPSISQVYYELFFALQ